MRADAARPPQLALALAARGSTPVLATVRGDVGPPELAAAGVTVAPGVDAATDAGEAALAAAAAAAAPVALLIYNAARMHKEHGLASFDAGRAAEQVATNACGFVRAVRAASQHLAPGARVVLISSKMGSIARAAAGAPGGAMLGYRMSKAAANAAAAALAADLRPRGVSVLAVHPGTIATDMYAYYHANDGGEDDAAVKALVASAGAAPPADAAAAVLRVALDAPADAMSPFVFRDESGGVLPW